MSFVYRYVDRNDYTIKYVGLVNGDDYSNLKSRINGHKSDDWNDNSTYDIDFIVLKTKNDAETLEAHFIAKYKTYEYYNKAKSGWGLSSFVNKANFIWSRYNRKVKDHNKCKRIVKCDIIFDTNKSLSEQIADKINVLNDYLFNDVCAIETNNYYVIPVSYIYNCLNQGINNKVDELMSITNRDYCLFKIKELEKDKKELENQLKQQQQVIQSLSTNKSSKTNNNFLLSKTGFASFLSKDEFRLLLNQNELFYFYCYFYNKNGDVIQKQEITRNKVTKYNSNGNVEVLDSSYFGGDFVGQRAYHYLWMAQELNLLCCNNDIGAINFLINYYSKRITALEYWQKELIIDSLPNALAKLNTYKTFLIIYLGDSQTPYTREYDYEILITKRDDYEITSKEIDIKSGTRKTIKQGNIKNDLLIVQSFIDNYSGKIQYFLSCPDNSIPHTHEINTKIIEMKEKLSQYQKELKKYSIQSI